MPTFTPPYHRLEYGQRRASHGSPRLRAQADRHTGRLETLAVTPGILQGPRTLHNGYSVAGVGVVAGNALFPQGQRYEISVSVTFDYDFTYYTEAYNSYAFSRGVIGIDVHGIPGPVPGAKIEPLHRSFLSLWRRELRGTEVASSNQARAFTLDTWARLDEPYEFWVWALCGVRATAYENDEQSGSISNGKLACSVTSISFNVRRI